MVIKTKPLKTSRLRRALIKASITWDYLCYLYTIKYNIYHMHVSTLMTLAKS